VSSDNSREGRTEEFQVPFAVEGEFSPGTEYLAGEDIRILQVDDGMLVGSPEERFGMVHEILVQGVGIRNKEGERFPPGTPRTPDLLPGSRHGAGKSRKDHAIKGSDIYSDLKGICGDHAPEYAVPEIKLQLASLLGEVPGTICADLGFSRTAVFGYQFGCTDCDQFRDLP